MARYDHSANLLLLLTMADEEDGLASAGLSNPLAPGRVRQLPIRSC